MSLMNWSKLKIFDKCFTATLDGPSSNRFVIAGNALTVGIAQGSKDSERTGRRINIRRLAGVIKLTGTPAHGMILVRLCLIIDKQANGAIPDFTDILGPDGAGGTTNETEAMFNSVNKQRFVFLWDELTTLEATAWGGDNVDPIFDDWSIPTQTFRFDIPMNLEIEYSGAAGALGEITSNNLLLCGYTDFNLQAAVATDWRIGFTDK